METLEHSLDAQMAAANESAKEAKINVISDDEADKLLAKNSLNHEEVRELWRYAFTRGANSKRVADFVEQSTGVKKGLLLFVIGHYERAAEALKQNSDMIGAYYFGRALLEVGKIAELKKWLEGQSGSKDFLLTALKGYVYEKEGQWNALAELTRNAQGVEDYADYHYLAGRVLENNGEYWKAQEAYERSLALDGEHHGALFRLAYHHGLRGEDDVAVQYYEKLRFSPPLNESAMINLGILYEDLGKYEKAIFCYETVLSVRPTHDRAQLYLKDANASLNMYYDEEVEKRQDKQKQILSTPVTDFELSVRSRNCLSKMNIRTLGDLVQKTEAELLSFKNFGETSLAEIKEMLTSRSLRLGMAREEQERKARADAARRLVEGTGRDDVMNKPVSDLEWSVRCEKCLNFLNIRVIGELANKTEAELLSVRNFGQSSINEVKQKLAEFGLSLKS